MAAAACDESHLRSVLLEAFGDSSDSESDAPTGAGGKRWRWEAVAGIRGLWLCADFLSADEQGRLLAAIQRGEFRFASIFCGVLLEGWFSDAHNQGICAHVDLMRFDDGIAIVSLESDCVMHFSQVKPGEGTACDILEQGGIESMKVPVHLNPGSLVLMSGDARYLWKHEINRKPGAQLWDGRELEQDCRTSVTLRKLLASPS
ncbi:hypothetical protein PR202_gb13649 [Eleusine coracana subsp. coracana]|uniref:Fe2OG dioxygenase domain-containing protein n=1 Tax=Eleusine coracana subsp. coracana TaxID=191504 RepID=A0AAV5ETQ6_ELECO|nr:hypothetical protein PR202_gb13649 [Eleusine coracana subsp. coracana]